MRSPSLNIDGAIITIILGIILGPTLFYAIAGDYWQTLTFLPSNTTTPRFIAGAIAIVALVLILFNAGRFRNAGWAGTLAGIAAGVSQLLAATLPTIAYAANHQAADPAGLNRNDMIQLLLTLGGFLLAIYAIGGYSLAVLMTSLRRRFS
jgi:hypothetical protein